MEDFVTGFIADLIGRTHGPMHYRLYFESLTAIAFAIRDGRKDAREGRPPYGWALLTGAKHRRYLLRDGWKGISRVFATTYAFDLLYQYVVLQGFRPLQAFTTAMLLALVPYVFVRGPVNRLMFKRNDDRRA
jgi:hypothetical protein